MQRDCCFYDDDRLLRLSVWSTARRRWPQVSNGGLSSFSLANMILAHLRHEQSAHRPIEDLGVQLTAFLRRYARMDLTANAVRTRMRVSVTDTIESSLI